MSRPTALLATKGIELLTMGTPNGYKASILLEELKDAYGLQYTWQHIDITKNIQKEPWFLATNPNGRIPSIVDHDHNGLPVAEGNAILSYLTRKYDPDNKFSFSIDDDDYTRAEFWIGWQHGGLGPMQGQANHFVRYAKEKIPYAMQRYVGEAERLYGILDAQLRDRDFVVGPGRGKFSIADIAILGWASNMPNSTLSMHQFPAVKSWYARCLERPAVARGFQIPTPPRQDPLSEELDDATKELKVLVDKAKEQYGYKYTSP